MKKLIKAIDFADVLVTVGITEIGIGLWWYKPWVSFTVVGSIVFSLGLLLSVPKAREK